MTYAEALAEWRKARDARDRIERRLLDCAPYRAVVALEREAMARVLEVAADTFSTPETLERVAALVD